MVVSSCPYRFRSLANQQNHTMTPLTVILILALVYLIFRYLEENGIV